MFSATHNSLSEEVKHLRGLLADTSASLPLDWHLSSTEERVFRALLARDFASQDLITEAAGVATPQSVRVHICRIRTKLKPHGISIETIHGKGWRLIGREQWQAILAAKNTPEGVN